MKCANDFDKNIKGFFLAPSVPHYIACSSLLEKKLELFRIHFEKCVAIDQIKWKLKYMKQFKDILINILNTLHIFCHVSLSML